MRFVLLAIIAMGRAVMADNEASPAPSKLATGAACKKDGSMGVCTSNFCLVRDIFEHMGPARETNLNTQQMPTDDTGVCQ
ncbi:hypothetical protein N7520_011275 [Penicillium odoratum]|uniref:uncharacterized protein n=1 Tax=Penicillium odoratum TaxID=1167516 RepID=UPI0025492F6D|nr:uncharacterized protein N7520_011275 [Penicillium odoratum]KAJ5746093.1 hypothetical protein N7520_011275 [Penicillium odoratum]